MRTQFDVANVYIGAVALCVPNVDVGRGLVKPSLYRSSAGYGMHAEQARKLTGGKLNTCRSENPRIHVYS